MKNELAMVESVLTARHQGVLTDGALHAPGDWGMELADSGTGWQAGWQAGWRISGKVSASMFLRLLRKRSPVDTAIHRIDSASGRGFLVIAQQRASWQHRLVLPLVGPTVGRLLKSFHSEGLRLHYEDVITGQATAFQIVDHEALVDVTAGRLRNFDDPKEILDELFIVTASLLLADSLPTPPGLEAPECICVSTVPPPELTAWELELGDENTPAG